MFGLFAGVSGGADPESQQQRAFHGIRDSVPSHTLHAPNCAPCRARAPAFATGTSTRTPFASDRASMRCAVRSNSGRHGEGDATPRGRPELGKKLEPRPPSCNERTLGNHLLWSQRRRHVSFERFGRALAGSRGAAQPQVPAQFSMRRVRRARTLPLTARWRTVRTSPSRGCVTPRSRHLDDGPCRRSHPRRTRTPPSARTHEGRHRSRRKPSDHRRRGHPRSDRHRRSGTARWSRPAASTGVRSRRRQRAGRPRPGDRR